MEDKTVNIRLQLTENLKLAVEEMWLRGGYEGKTRNEIYELLLWRGLERTALLKKARKMGEECI